MKPDISTFWSCIHFQLELHFQEGKTGNCSSNPAPAATNIRNRSWQMSEPQLNKAVPVGYPPVNVYINMEHPHNVMDNAPFTSTIYLVNTMMNFSSHSAFHYHKKSSLEQQSHQFSSKNHRLDLWSWLRMAVGSGPGSCVSHFFDLGIWDGEKGLGKSRGHNGIIWFFDVFCFSTGDVQVGWLEGWWSIEHGHRNSGLFPLKMVIFHSKLFVITISGKIQVTLTSHQPRLEFRLGRGHVSCSGKPSTILAIFLGKL